MAEGLKTMDVLLPDQVNNAKTLFTELKISAALFIECTIFLFNKQSLWINHIQKVPMSLFLKFFTYFEMSGFWGLTRAR